MMDRNLGRLAFACSDNQVHMMPVLFEFDGSNFYLSGWNLKYSERFNDLPEKNSVTLLIDDIDSPTRWATRGVEIIGQAESKEKDDYLYVRIKPVTKTSWGL